MQKKLIVYILWFYFYDRWKLGRKIWKFKIKKNLHIQVRHPVDTRWSSIGKPSKSIETDFHCKP